MTDLSFKKLLKNIKFRVQMKKINKVKKCLYVHVYKHPYLYTYSDESEKPNSFVKLLQKIISLFINRGY